MSEEKDYSFNDGINFVKKIWVFCIKRFYIFIVFFLVGIGVGLGYFNFQKPKYVGYSSAILQERTSSIGSLSSLASQLGFDISGASSGGSLFAGENILEILGSYNIISKALLTKVGENNKAQTLADIYIEHNKLKSKWESSRKPELALVNFNNVEDKTEFTEMQDSVMQIIYNAVFKKITIERASKKTTVIHVTLSTDNKILAQQLPLRMIQEAAKFYIDVKVSLLKRNVEKFERKSDSLLNMLNRRSYAAAETRIIDPNSALSSIIVPTELANRDKTISMALFTESVKQLETARMFLLQETPVIQILDVPGKSIIDTKMKKMLCVIYGSILMQFFAFVYVLISFVTKMNRKGGGSLKNTNV